MTWEETIRHIQNTPSYAALVRDTYIATDLSANVERFRLSAEWRETLALLEKYKISPPAKLLDMGAGNGIAGISFALLGYAVTAAEPDPSDTVGRGAIKILSERYQLSTLQVVEAFGEKLPFDDATFEVVYVRQALHHAADLGLFMQEVARVLKRGGLVLTLRDHVVTSQKDKEKFLQRHPLHHYYGGENAFTLAAYRGAFEKAGLTRLQEISPSASPINYDPWSKKQLEQLLSTKFGTWIGAHSWLLKVAWWLSMIRKEYLPGKLYSFVARKP